MIDIVPQGTRFDFFKYRYPTALASVVVILLGLGVMAWRGPNLGIDFAGGSLVHVRFKQATTTQEVREALAGTDLEGVDIQNLDDSRDEFLIRTPLVEEGEASITNAVAAALQSKYGEGVDILRVETVGPRVGETLRSKAILAIAFATVMMGVYISARFEWRFGIGAAAALIHDVLVTVAVLVFFNYEFDLTVVAALLSIVGYSVNDTVVISDRIRENLAKDRRSSLRELINNSLNETLSRTILTTGMTLIMVISLLLLGGPVIRGFAFSLLVGFIAGVYSTVYIASSIVLYLGERYPAARKVA